MRRLIRRFLDRIDTLGEHVGVLAAAMQDSRTPMAAKLTAALTVGLALSPIDPIPDVIPVIGHLDDLVLVPLGVFVTWRLLPDEVLADARSRSEARSIETGRLPLFVAAGTLLLWLVLGVAVALAILPAF